MNFEFSEDQKFVQQTARDYLAEHSPLTVCREILETDKPYADDLWKGTAEMGYQGAVIPEEYGGAGFGYLELAMIASEIGYPVLVKATAGGGGKGMRIATSEDDLKNALEQAAQEAEAAFGNAGVYLEKFIELPRHVEVQILADMHGKGAGLTGRENRRRIEDDNPVVITTGNVRNQVLHSLAAQ